MLNKKKRGVFFFFFFFLKNLEILRPQIMPLYVSLRIYIYEKLRISKILSQSM